MKKVNLKLSKQTIEVLQSSSHHYGGAESQDVCKPVSNGVLTDCWIRLTDQPACYTKEESRCYCLVSGFEECVPIKSMGCHAQDSNVAPVCKGL